jgi:hypothetical protein
MQMQLGSDVQIRDGLLAENTLLSEKPRLGFERTETTVHQASIRLNYLNGNRVSSTVVFEGRQVSLMAQQQNGASEKLKYRTVKAHDPRLSNHAWTVRWGLTHKSKTGGWIVQHIQADFTGAGHYDYWEAWQVPANSRFTTFHGAAPYDDAFDGPPGSHVNASARFYEGLQLPGSFTVHHNFPAGVLPATTVDPHLPLNNATPTDNRTWTAPTP